MQTTDYIIPGLYLLTLCAITWHFRKARLQHRDFFLAGRSIGALPVGLSVMVTTFSAVNYLALPGEVYGYGLYVLASLPAFFIAALPVTLYWMPFFQKLHAVSVYAFLEQRFDLRVRILCSSLFLVWRLFWMAVALYASCRIMSLLTGLDFLLLTAVCGVFAALYSSIGGMKAVIWTDVMQFCVLFGSILLAVCFVWENSDFHSVLAETGKLKPFAPFDPRYLSFDPRERITLWSALIGTTVAFLTRFGADQMVMQRYLAARDLKSAQRGLWINGIASTLSLGLLAVFGLAVAAYAQQCGIPAKTPPVKVIALLLRSFPAGVIGMVGAGLLAATMSSIDSGLNSCSAAIVIDFQERFGWKKISPRLLTLLLAGPVLLCAAFILPLLNKEQTLFEILNKTINTMGTPLLAVMLCALFWKKSKAKAVFAGTLFGIVLTLILSIMVQHFALHYYAVFSLLVTLGGILLFQLCSFRSDHPDHPA